MCQRIAVVFLVGIILWACSVSFNGVCNAFEVDSHYKVRAVGSVGEYGD